MSDHAIIADRIYTLREPGEYYEAMVLKQNRIKSLTSLEFINNDNEKFEKTTQIKGIIIPGFIDAHIHMMGFGSYLNRVDLRKIDNKNEMIDIIKRKSKKTPKGQWILGFGWDQSKFNNKYPTRHELDLATNKHPVMLTRACNHILVVNSMALKISNIGEKTLNPKGGIIDKDKTGKMTGIFRETAMKFIQNAIPEPSNKENQEYLLEGMKHLNSVGITSVQTNDPKSHNIYESIKEKLSVRVYLTPNIDEMITLSKKRFKTGHGDDWLRFGRIKIFLDGSLGAETAALREPYQNSKKLGVLIHSRDEVKNLVNLSDKNGWQLELHAIGDKSTEIALDAFESLTRLDARPVITHCQVLAKDLIMKMAQKKVIANIQPIFINTDMRWAEERLGKSSERMKFSYAWKTLLKEGVICSGGSDAPIEPPNPLYGVHSAVNRQNLKKYPAQGWRSSEKLTTFEAFKLFTTNATYAEYQEENKGMLVEGMLADFVVLDKDPFLINPKNLLEINVIATYVDGNRVFQKHN